ncbi:MAG: alpha/beta hydrolase, partial [Gemmatimonadales bacterium]
MTEVFEYQTGAFPGSGGLTLTYQSWRPRDRSPHAVVIAVHGLGDHSGLYAPGVEHLVPRGYAWYGFDLRGHGRSPGPRGHIQSWAEYREDLRAFLGLIGEMEPGRTRFLLGNSLGGLIVLDYALHYPESLDGVVAIGAPLGRIGVP